ncbi:MAG: hypothetical protein OEZ43_20370 [Gammaproteobacteria bacterium]|nr:hypothetical protein [Gammaproteobacteria bacterium]
MKRKVLLSVFALVLSVSEQAIAATTAQEYELRYRDVYFHYYSRDYFTAITRGLAEQEMQRLATDKRDFDLLLGLLYSGYGLKNDAEAMLTQVTKSAKNRVRLNSARFYLARQYYEDGQAERALSLLSKTDGELPEFLVSQSLYLNFFLMAQLGRSTQSEDALKKLKNYPYWYQYAAYNHGASLIKAGDLQHGISFLNEVGEDESKSLEMRALADKANTALGFHFLKVNQPEQAVNYFQRVKLDGPYSHKAMLGLGWAYSQQKDYEHALTPWLQLARGAVHETTVQEGVLASAFALQKIGAQQDALNNYENAIAIYQMLKDNIQITTHKIRNGEITSALIQGEDFSDAAISDRLATVLKRDQGHLLGKLLQETHFQKAFRQYRDLRDLSVRLQNWKQQVRPYVGLRNSRNQTAQSNGPAVNPDILWQRLEERGKRLESLLKDYELSIQRLMVEALDKQHLFVSNYLSQARYAVAQLLDEQVPRR